MFRIGKKAVIPAALALSMLCSPTVMAYDIDVDNYILEEDAGYSNEDFVVLAYNDFTAKANAIGTKISVSWDPVKDANEYVVYMKKNGKYEHFKTTRERVVNIPNLTTGVTYYFKVVPVINGVESTTISAVAYAEVAMDKPVLKAVAQSTSVKLDWTNVSAAKKYAVYQVNSKGKLVKLKEVKKHTYTVTGLKPNTRYKFAVKAYIGGKWTKVEGSDMVAVRTKSR